MQLFVHVAAAPSSLTWVYLAVAGVVVAAAAVTTQQVRKKNQKQPKQNIIWTVTAPPKIRKGGRTYAHITLTNSGMVPISNATITIVAPHDFRTDPIIRLEPLAPNQTTYVPLRIGSVQNAAIGKKTISLTLNTGQTAPQIRPLILSVQTLRVGLLLDSHNQSYTQHLSSALSDPFRPWLEKHHYEYETITESSLSNTQKYNVVLAPNQYALTNQDIDALRTYTNSGGGLVALGSIGIIDADKPLASGDAAVKVSRISEVLGYQRGETSEVERCYGIRMVQGEHPISKGEKMDQVNQIQFRGSVYVKPVTTGTLIAEERVRLSSGDLVIPAIVANHYGKGRAVHFNINPSESMNALDSLIEKAVDWAANFL